MRNLFLSVAWFKRSQIHACTLVFGIQPEDLGESLPGSQEMDSLQAAWWVHRLVWPACALGALITLITTPGVYLTRERLRGRIALVAGLLLSGALFLGGTLFSASIMFKPPEKIVFAQGTSEELPPETLILGVASTDPPRAYPVRLLAYHHFLEDASGEDLLLPTY